MNKAEAREFLAKELLHYRAKNYEISEANGSPQVIERDGVGGVSYTIEIRCFGTVPEIRAVI